MAAETKTSSKDFYYEELLDPARQLYRYRSGTCRELGKLPAPWRELDRAYLAHHAQCNACQCAGRGYGERCPAGAALWAAYLAESSI